MKVVVIGGGPAGIMSAISAKNSGNDVILIEKMNSLGKKLLITGKGRCNITSSLNINEFIQNIPGNGRFLYSAFQNFTNEDIINLLKKHNVKVKEERGNRIFPVSDKSKDVIELTEILSNNNEINMSTTDNVTNRQDFAIEVCENSVFIILKSGFTNYILKNELSYKNVFMEILIEELFKYFGERRVINKWKFWGTKFFYIKKYSKE